MPKFHIPIGPAKPAPASFGQGLKKALVLTLQKSNAVLDGDGVLTDLGVRVAEQYARAWIAGARRLDLERQYEDLVGLFYDIRSDAKLAQEHAIEA